jgi:hypothetical protein
MLGPPSARGTAFLVTCPSEAADDPAFMRRLAAAGVDAVRINRARDDSAAWGRMIPVPAQDRPPQRGKVAYHRAHSSAGCDGPLRAIFVRNVSVSITATPRRICLQP